MKKEQSMLFKEVVDKSFIEELQDLQLCFHKNPELSCREYETSKFLKEYVLNLGFNIKPVSETGFIANYKFETPGKTLAIRTDIDALPIIEDANNLKGLKKCISKNKGIMHACGHDAHMSILLICLKLIIKYKEFFSGELIAIFEDGEECGAGIDNIVSTLKDYSIDAIYGNHVYNGLDTGKVIINKDYVMAACGMFDVQVVGQGGHGSRPDYANSPIVCTNSIISTIYQMLMSRIDVEKTVTFAVTKLQAGNTLNVIPNICEFGGTLRYFDYEQGELAINIIQTICNSIGAAYNCDIIFKELIADRYSVKNDCSLAEIAQNALIKNYPESLVTNQRWYASETFSRYSKIAPCVFTLVGIRNSELGTGAEHHNSRFEVDPEGLKYGLATMFQFSLDFLNNN